MTAIVFDLDGTLIDSVGDIHAALNQMLGRAGYEPLDRDTVTSFVGKGSSNLVKRVIEHVGLPNDTVSHTNYLTEFLDIYTSAPARFTTVFDQVLEVLKNFQSLIAARMKDQHFYLYNDQQLLAQEFEQN